MTTNALTDYMLYLVDVACDGPHSFEPPPMTPNITAAATFVADTLRTMGSEGILITRTGSERAADILFAHPDVMKLFGNAEAAAGLRAIIFGEVLPAATPVFRDHWNHIIGPAMDEHMAVALLMRSST
jgi:hypothetical protein